MIAATPPSIALPRRWHTVNLDPRQLAYLKSTARINVVAAGRRAFKTEGAKRRVLRGALMYRGRNSKYDDGSEGQFFATAPTHQQAKDIFWRDLVSMTPQSCLRTGNPLRDISHSELRIQLRNNCVIRVAGLDKPQRIEGGFWDGGVISEYGNTKPGLVDENIRPMMITGGWLDIEGVPEGRNHYYDLWEEANENASGEYMPHHWTTGEVLWRYLGRQRANEEMASAMKKMDREVYNQEYNADFINFTGRAYYNFERDVHVHKVEYDPRLPLVFCFDFNEEPGVAVVCQEGNLPKELNGGKVLKGTKAIGEVYIPRNSKTPKVVKKLATDWHKKIMSARNPQPVYLHGDATGGAGGSSAVEGSDWELVNKYMKQLFPGVTIRDRVPKANPYERVRVNSVNSRLESADGVRRMAVDPSCKYLIRDLEGVVTVEGGSGEIDKPSKGEGSMLTHISDAIGYYITEDFPFDGGVLSDITSR